MVRGRTWANQHRVRECGRRTTVYNGSQRFLAVPARSECHRPDQTDARIHAVESHVGIKLACRSGKVRCCTALPEHVPSFDLSRVVASRPNAEEATQSEGI
eukprot:1538603-Rhodomonas_salina.1